MQEDILSILFSIIGVRWYGSWADNIMVRQLVCTGVAESWPDGVAWETSSLFGVLEEWLLLAWRVIMEIGQGREIIFPSVGGRTPSRSKIFMMRLQKGILVHVADRALVFPIVWKMWAQMSIGTPIMRSHRNCTLPRFMMVVLYSGQRLENMINFRVVSSGENCAMPIDDPLLLTSWSGPRTQHN